MIHACSVMGILDELDDLTTSFSSNRKGKLDWEDVENQTSNFLQNG